MICLRRLHLHEPRVRLPRQVPDKSPAPQLPQPPPPRQPQRRWQQTQHSVVLEMKYINTYSSRLGLSQGAWSSYKRDVITGPLSKRESFTTLKNQVSFTTPIRFRLLYLHHNNFTSMPIDLHTLESKMVHFLEPMKYQSPYSRLVLHRSFSTLKYQCVEVSVFKIASKFLYHEISVCWSLRIQD